MRFLITLLAILSIVGCTLQVNPTIIQQPKQEVAKKSYDVSESFGSVGRISVKQRGGVGRLSGTAFAYDKDTLLTAGHVCIGIYELQVMGIVEDDIQLTYLNRNDKQETKHGIEILEIDEPHDICLVKLEDHGLKPLKIANYASVKFNDRVFVVGAPAGFMLSAKEGRVMQKWSEGQPIPQLNRRLIIDAPSTGGNSGGPILNDKGEVIGILVMGHSTYDHLTIGVPSVIVKRFLRLVGK